MPMIARHAATLTRAGEARRGPGLWRPRARESLTCGLPGPLAEARIPARAPPAIIGILVTLPAIILDTMVLHVAFAGRWVLGLLRSVGQLGPTLGSFTVFSVLALRGRHLRALPLRHLGFPCRPTLFPHRDPRGMGDVAALLGQAAPPPVVLWLSPLAACTGASLLYCTAPSGSVEQRHQATPTSTGTSNAAMLFPRAAGASWRRAVPSARAVAMTLHNHGDIGRQPSTAWAGANALKEGGRAEEP